MEVHIEGIPYSWTETELEGFFDKCGKVVSVKMPTWQDSGRSKGYGFVTFADADSVKEALQLDKSEVEGRWLKVSEARESTPGQAPSASFSSTPEDDCKNLFVKNLPYDANEDSIGQIFESYGEVVSIRIANENGRSKGFCFIEFAEPKSVTDIVAATTGGKVWTMGERSLVLDYGSGKPRAGFHPRRESYDSRFGNSHKDISKKGGKGKGKGFGKGKGKGKGFGKGKGKGFGKGKGSSRY
jgi:nucleolin